MIIIVTLMQKIRIFTHYYYFYHAMLLMRRLKHFIGFKL